MKPVTELVFIGRLVYLQASNNLQVLIYSSSHIIIKLIKQLKCMEN